MNSLWVGNRTKILTSLTIFQNRKKTPSYSSDLSNDLNSGEEKVPGPLNPALCDTRLIEVWNITWKENADKERRNPISRILINENSSFSNKHTRKEYWYGKKMKNPSLCFCLLGFFSSARAGTGGSSNEGKNLSSHVFYTQIKLCST